MNLNIETLGSISQLEDLTEVEMLQLELDVVTLENEVNEMSFSLKNLLTTTGNIVDLQSIIDKADVSPELKLLVGEHLEAHGISLESKEVAMEGIGEELKKAIEKVKAFFRKIIDWIKKLFQKRAQLFGVYENTLKRVEKTNWDTLKEQSSPTTGYFKSKDIIAKITPDLPDKVMKAMDDIVETKEGSNEEYANILKKYFSSLNPIVEVTTSSSPKLTIILTHDGSKVSDMSSSLDECKKVIISTANFNEKLVKSGLYKKVMKLQDEMEKKMEKENTAMLVSPYMSKIRYIHQLTDLLYQLVAVCDKSVNTFRPKE